MPRTRAQVRKLFSKASRMGKGKSPTQRKLIFKRVFASSPSKRKTTKSRKTKTITRSVTPVARKRRSTKRSSFRRRTKKSIFNNNLIGTIAAPLLDGALLQPLASRLGLQVSDDIIRVAAPFALQALGIGKGGILKQALQGIQTVGVFNLSNQFVGGAVGNILGGSGASSMPSGVGAGRII